MSMNAAIEPQQSEFSVRISRFWIVFGIGALVGFIWVLPVFGPPGVELSKQGNGASAIRFLRLIAPLFVFFIIRRPVYLKIAHSLLLYFPQGRISRAGLRIFGVILVLGIIPLASGLLTANTNFLISAVFPLTLSVITLIGLVLLDEKTLKYWVMGATAMTLIFLVLGMFTTHFEVTNYWGRPRIVLGFIHPIYTASAILGGMIFFFLTMGLRVQKMPTATRFLVIGIYLVVSLVLLVLAQDRNQLVMVVLSMIGIVSLRKLGQRIKFSVFAFLLLLPVALYLFVIFGSDANPVWAAVNAYSSERLSFFQDILVANLNLSDSRILFEASENRQSAFTELAGFAATDSVYLTFLINYGIFALLLFVTFLLFLGKRLSEIPEATGALGILCGLVILYALDASGVTTSNLILFILLAYVVRTAVLKTDTRQAASLSTETVLPRSIARR